MVAFAFGIGIGIGIGIDIGIGFRIYWLWYTTDNILRTGTSLLAELTDGFRAASTTKPWMAAQSSSKCLPTRYSRGHVAKLRFTR